MLQTPPVPSIAALGASAHDVVATHMRRTFAQARDPQVRATAHGIELLTGAPHPLGNAVLLERADDEAGARAAVTTLADVTLPSAVILPVTPTPAVDEILRAAGFVEHGAMPTMAVDLDALGSSALPEGCAFVRVHGDDVDQVWADAFAEGYELPQALADIFSPNRVGAGADDASPVQYFAVVEDGRYVATSMLHLYDGLAGIYCVSTLPSARRRGLGAHVTAEPLRRARALGYGVGLLQSSEPGHNVYLGLGFRDLGGLPLFLRMPA